MFPIHISYGVFCNALDDTLLSVNAAVSSANPHNEIGRSSKTHHEKFDSFFQKCHLNVVFLVEFIVKCHLNFLPKLVLYFIMEFFKFSKGFRLMPHEVNKSKSAYIIGKSNEVIVPSLAKLLIGPHIRKYEG